MIEVNWSWIKSWSKIESITAIYMSNKSGSWKQSTSSQIYINLVRPLLILYSIYTCAKEFNTTNQRVESLNTPDLAFVWQTSQEAMCLPPPPSCLEGLKEEIWPEVTLPIILSFRALRIWVTYFWVQTLMLVNTNATKYHILEAKQHCPKQLRCPAVQTGV